ncbi:MAG: HD domain-containing protein [Desulfurococcales archaeon]|nr:HD domain-containing protein [Desulfurococcales archaeon]
MPGLLAWCGEDLVGHCAGVAVVAWRLYRVEWVRLAERLSRGGVELPIWALPLAAALHDVGLALPCYQAEIERYCRDPKPWGARLKGHEAASAYAAAAVLAGMEERGYPLSPGEAAGLWAAAKAAMLHHHDAVTSSLAPPGCSLDAAITDGIPVMLDVLGAACRLAGGRGLPCPGWLLSPEPPRRPPGSEVTDSLILEPRGLGPAALRAYRVAATFLTGVVALADSLVSSLCRLGSPGWLGAQLARERPGLSGELEGPLARAACGGGGPGG